MPNWSNCIYRIKGKRKHLRNLNSILNKLGKRKNPLEDSDFGNYWLGCLVKALGSSWREVDGCRGEIYSYNLYKDYLEINFEVAWSESKELRDFLERYYNNEIKIWFYQEEPGCGVFETNSYDEFGFKYSLDGEIESLPEYYNSLEDVAAKVGEITGEKVNPSIKEIEDAIEKAEEKDNIWMSLNKFELVKE